MKRERRTIKQKLESAAHFWYEAHDAVEDAWGIQLEIIKGRNPKSMLIPNTITKRSGTDDQNMVVGWSASYWDACALKVRSARAFLGRVQSHCRQLARAGLKKEGKR